MLPAIAYTRLSKPNKKGKPGIGLDAQQEPAASPSRGLRWSRLSEMKPAVTT
jgi:hypothetical protein